MRMEELKPYAVVKDPAEPKGSPKRYFVAKVWVLPFLISDASVLGLFDTMDAALNFLQQLLL